MMSHYFFLFTCLYIPIFISYLYLTAYYFLNLASFTRNS